MKELVKYGGTVIVVILLILKLFIFSTVFASGSSMYPTVKNNDCLLLSRHSNVDRGDIVAIYSSELNKKLCKRVVALEGDKVEWQGGTLLVNGKIVQPVGKTTDKNTAPILYNSLTVGLGEVYVVGDNRSHSTDSRHIGTLRKSDILGVLVCDLGNVGISRRVYFIILSVIFALLLVAYSSPIIKKLFSNKKQYSIDKSE